MHFAVHSHTAAERIFDGVDSDKPLIGMTHFKGDSITKDDVKIATHYLSEIELTRLNLLVSQFFDCAEFQALEQRSMSMADWIEVLDNQIISLRREVLQTWVAFPTLKRLKKLKKNLKCTASRR